MAGVTKKVFFLSAICVLLTVSETRAEGWRGQVPRRVEEVPFINGSLWCPPIPEINNEGIVQQQGVPGLTHIEMYVPWRFIESEQGRGNWEEVLRTAHLAQSKGLKVTVFPWIQFVPEWFKKSRSYQPLVEVGTGKEVEMLSPWSGGSEAALNLFYSGLSRAAGQEIDIVSVGFPCSDYGEIGLVLGAPSFLDPKKHAGRLFPQQKDAWHPGFWCGDRYAVARFRDWAVRRYGTLEKLNQAWGTGFHRADDIEYPDFDKRMKMRRYWVDFMLWYQESVTDFAEVAVRYARKYFRRNMLEVKLGFGDDNPRYGLDRTAVIKRLAPFDPITIRSTHGGFNRNGNRAYWFYKRMAPLAQTYRAGFGSEPPGGDLTREELSQQIFEDASAGVNYVFHYFQNYHLGEDVVGEYKNVLRPQEKSLVDIGILYPTSQVLLDASGFPEGQPDFCDKARDILDYDVVDENMIEWEMLRNYRLLIQTGGVYLEQKTIVTLDQWLRSGGIMILREDRMLSSIEGYTAVCESWKAGESKGVGAGREYEVGKGKVVVLPFGDLERFVTNVNGALSTVNRDLGRRRLRGYDGKADGLWTTEFPRGRLVYNANERTATYEK